MLASLTLVHSHEAFILESDVLVASDRERVLGKRTCASVKMFSCSFDASALVLSASWITFVVECDVKSPDNLLNLNQPQPSEQHNKFCDTGTLM